MSDLKDAYEMKDFSGSQIRDRLSRSRRTLFEELLSLKQIDMRIEEISESSAYVYSTQNIHEIAALQLESQHKTYLVAQMLFSEVFNPLFSSKTTARLFGKHTRAINQIICKGFPDNEELQDAAKMFNGLTKFIDHNEEEDVNGVRDGPGRMDAE